MQLDMQAVYLAGGVGLASAATMPSGQEQGGLVWTPSMQRMFTLVKAYVATLLVYLSASCDGSPAGAACSGWPHQLGANRVAAARVSGVCLSWDPWQACIANTVLSDTSSLPGGFTKRRAATAGESQCVVVRPSDTCDLMAACSAH